MAISRMNMERQMRNMGGIMTLEEPRQGYFLGKLVKKATRAVKKVAKSPLGKAALIYAGTAGLGSLGAGGGFGSLFKLGTYAPSAVLGNLGAAFTKGSALSKSPFSSLFFDPKTGGFSLGRTALTGLGATAIAAPFLMGGDEEEVDEGTPFTDPQASIESIRQQARDYYQDPTRSALYFMPPKSAVRFGGAFAEGGLADIPREGYESGERVSGILKLLSRLTPFGAAKELASNIDMDDLKKLSMITPAGAGKKAAEGLAGMDMDILKRLSMFTPAGAAVQLGKKLAMKDGGMIDMGGLEKDYREGGFVPIGAEERADDVPARLSKNEFVFTADAVRNAGGGDIDKGAEVMQNMMDNLEAGGTISEESQGMENPAQAMFDQAQQFEGRIE